MHLITVTCPVLGSIENGTTTLATDGISTVATFSCDLGFTLRGHKTISCDSSGEWREQLPACGKTK